MSVSKKMDQLGLDWANGKLTLTEMLWEAYSYGYGDGHDDGVQDAKSGA